MADGNEGKATEMESEIRRIKQKFTKELIKMLELMIVEGESPKINRELIEMA